MRAGSWPAVQEAEPFLSLWADTKYHKRFYVCGLRLYKVMPVKRTVKAGEFGACSRERSAAAVAGRQFGGWRRSSGHFRESTVFENLPRAWRSLGMDPKLLE